MERAPENHLEAGFDQRRAGHRSYRRTVSVRGLPGSGDDGLDRPTVTPAPAPSDDQLIRLAAVSSAAGLVIAVLVARWLKRHIVVSWRP
jgi:hypothetical protein